MSPQPIPASSDGTIDILTGSEDTGARLDKWLSEKLENLTRSRLKALIEAGALRRDGTIFTDPSWKIREGERFVLEIPVVTDPEPKAEDIKLSVAFEDNDIIVVDKPAGMVVHPAAGNWTGTLVNALIGHCGASLSGIGGVARPGIVHRLDKDTSGLIVVAKNDAAHLKLTQAFAAHDIDRVYQAICVGAPRPSSGTVDAPLARLGGDRKKMAVVQPALTTDDAEEPANGNGLRKGAKHAITHYKLVDAFGRSRAKLPGDAIASLIDCTLETGRTHQIRVHMSHIGHPLVGDPVYGRGPGLSGLKPDDPDAERAIATLRKFRRQALHAKVLGFDHPATGAPIRLETDAPADFNRLLSDLSVL
ncbi:MAG: RluA family pseudouridine synthase [Pseudomonadota bacterium]